MVEGTLVKLDSATVPAGSGQATVEFTNINQNYDDLLLVFSVRNTGDFNTVGLRINGATTNQTARRIIGSGSGNATSSTYTEVQNTPSSATASVYGSGQIYIANYRSSNNKSISIDAVSENNATLAYATMESWLWSSSSAITSLGLTGLYGGSIAQFSTLTLYGVTRIPRGAKATGGVVYDDANYWYHVFTSTGVFTPNQNVTCDYLVVAGGGGGAGWYGGGGGAGGLRSTVGSTGGLGTLESPISVSSGTSYTITVGAGGPSQTQGSNSVFSTITATGGGRGGSYESNSGGGNGGSGGGAGSGNGSGVWLNAGQASPVGQGFNGGAGNGSNSGSAGGGGAGGAASNASASPNGTATNGGVGLQLTSWASVTGTGVSNGYFAGGGGGGSTVGGGNGAYAGTGGLGGGGAGSLTANSGVATAGTANTGGGGGGSGYNVATGGAGGSGIVIIRYSKA